MSIRPESRYLLFAAAFWMASASSAQAQCNGDFDGSNTVMLDELIEAVGNALDGCPSPAPTATATPTPTFTATATATPTATSTSTPTPTATPTDTPTPTSTPTATRTPTETPTVTPTFTPTPLPRCGDGLADPEEECDGIDVNNLTCADSGGGPFGQVSCTEECTLDTALCAPTRFVDNADGTITDHRTGLMWEKKCAACGGLHDVDHRYPWQGSCSGSGVSCRTDESCTGAESCEAADDQDTDRTIFEWVNGVNAEQFAGHSDWNVPSLAELETLRNLATFDPAIDSAFHRSACADVTNPVCSRTFPSNYWSATNLAGNPDNAWDVNFDDGSVGDSGKSGTSYVRAVRRAF